MSTWSNYATIEFLATGGIPNDDSAEVQWHNGQLLNATLQSIPSETVLKIEGTYYVMGGIYAADLSNVVIRLDGQLIFSTKVRQWPRRRSDGKVLPCMELVNPTNL
eukprot:526370-Ditylum_brightwellii.AAC.1